MTDPCTTSARAERSSASKFAVPASQPDLRLELARVTRLLFGVCARPRDEWAVVIPGIRVADYVETIGLSGKAHQKRIPTWVFESPEAHREAFLGGYVDADGDVRSTPANEDMGLTSGDPELLEDARRLAVSCGIRTSRIWDFRSRDPSGRPGWITGYRMRFAGDFDRIACRSERRRARMRKRKYFHTDTGVGGTTIRTHTSEWLGFARIEQVIPTGPGTGYVLDIGSSTSLVLEGVLVGAVGPLPA